MSNTLVVLLHGYGQTSAQRLAAVRTQVRQTWPDLDPAADIYCPDLALGLFSRKDPDHLVAELLEAIDRRWQESADRGEPLRRIVIVGHSIGALLGRKLYVVACGETELAPFEPAYKTGTDGLLPPRPWAFAVERIVLLAGMNRGWRLTHHMGLTTAAFWAPGTVFAHLMGLVGRPLLIMAFRKGATFLTQLRLQWLRMRYRAKADPARPGNALTVQLLGSRDDVVSPEDNIDLASGGDFLYLDVPNSNHKNVVEMDDPSLGAARAAMFRLALAESAAVIEQEAVLPSDDLLIGSNVKVERVLFVMHGIRDAGYWTHKVARRVRKLAGGSRLATWATETSSYGYFPMLPFLFPWPRRQKVEWFMDQYAEAVARYPLASFAFVGHSNGTYLLAKALELYPCCRFDRVVFAGSVVRRTFDWGRYLDTNPPQVESVLNLVGSRDWVVAWFPNLFEWLWLPDLGSAGHNGFALAGRDPRVQQVVAVRGGHGAGVEEEVWDTIARYVVSADREVTLVPALLGTRNWFVRGLGHIAPVVWIAILAAIFVLGMEVVMRVGAAFASPYAAGFAAGLALAVFARGIWLVVTRL